MLGEGVQGAGEVMAKGLEGNVEEFSNSLERGSAKECMDGQAEKKDGKGQAVGENLLGNTDQMVKNQPVSPQG